MKKKILSLMAFLFLSSSMFAQLGVDVTDKYLTNAGFDEDISLTAAGTAAKGTDDGSAWTPNSSGGYDGMAVQIKGWTKLYNYSAPKWLIMASLPYDYDPSTKYKAPERPLEANTPDNTGVLRLTAGWGGRVGYKQKVEVPAGKYRLTYSITNRGAINTKAANYCRIQCGDDDIIDNEGFNSKTWIKREYDLTCKDSLTITFGFGSVSSAGSGSNPVLYVDDIHLYKLDGVTQEEMLADALNTLLKKANGLLASLSYEGLTTELKDAIETAKDKQTSSDIEVLQDAYDSLNNTFNAVSNALGDITTIDKLLQRIERILDTTNYPGANDLEDKKFAAEDTEAIGNSEAIANEVDILYAAIDAYYQSQEASEEHPADYTYLIQHPWFINPEAEPTMNDNGEYIFPNAANYKNGSSCPDANSGGWYIGPSGGDQRTNVAIGRPCWNAWNLNFSTISINQNISNLPNGYYKLSADFDIQAGCATSQHIYAKSNAGDITSNTDWNTIDDYVANWKTITTDGKVLVTDGKLTIGAASTGDTQNTPADFGGVNTDKRRGWFLVTNFKLYYLGAASKDDIEKAFQEKLADAKACADTMHLAADKAAFKAVINAYLSADTEEMLNKALDTLVKAKAVALRSEAKYKEVMGDNKTIKLVADSLLNYGEAAYVYAHDIVAFASREVQNYLESDKATYTALDNIVARLNAYANNYSAVFNQASDMSESSLSDVAAEYLNQLQAAQSKTLTTDSLATDSLVAVYVNELKSAIIMAQRQNSYEENPNATDFTGFIQNAKAEATDGWYLYKGYGDKTIGSGQYYNDSDAKHRYFDSYNSTAGKLDFYGYQIIEGVPNGTYTVTVDARTSGEGAFIFAAEDTTLANATWLEIPLQTYTYTDASSGAEITVNATDMYGQIWEQATKDFENDGMNAELAAIVTANAGRGYGWEHIAMDNIIVNNHKIVIGMTTDSKYSGKAFTGKWFSITNWTLNMTAAGDNSDWNGPISTGIQTLPTVKHNVSNGIYNMSGVKLDKIKGPGLYIIINDGKPMKYIKK